jgi:hypothetical protein
MSFCEFLWNILRSDEYLLNYAVVALEIRKETRVRLRVKSLLFLSNLKNNCYVSTNFSSTVLRKILRTSIQQLLRYYMRRQMDMLKAVDFILHSFFKNAPRMACPLGMSLQAKRI